MPLKRDLTALEARALAVLVEKQSTVPDSYPLSLNALTLGINQKTARDPVMNASEADVLLAIDGLKEQSLVFEGSGSRVVRFEHNLGRVLGVPSQSVAVLAVLLLRGPQTAAELRLNTERLHRFADVSSVEGFLEELAEHDPPYVVKLARAPGAREPRWADLLRGDVALPAYSAADDEAERASRPVRSNALADEVARLHEDNARLTAEVAELRALVARIAAELGIEGAAP